MEKIMGYTYAVVGAGRQGTAAAYDMAKLGDAEILQKPCKLT